MKLLISLGNPGGKYKNTRHNVGHLVVDSLQTIVHEKDLTIKRSDSFMNDSGSFVSKQIKNCKLEIKNLVVVHDDLDIPLGKYKIQFGKGPKNHKGIIDIQEKLGTNDFWYVRVGVDNRDPKNRIPGEQYVLEDFTNEEKIILDRIVIEICKKLATL